MQSKGIRGLDPELYRQAKAQAALEGKTIGQWLNEAIREKLEKVKSEEGRRK